MDNQRYCYVIMILLVILIGPILSLIGAVSSYSGLFSYPNECIIYSWNNMSASCIITGTIIIFILLVLFIIGVLCRVLIRYIQYMCGYKIDDTIDCLVVQLNV